MTDAPVTGIPLFPASVLKSYTAPKSFIDNLDLTEFAGVNVNNHIGKFSNILIQPKFEEIRIWIEECAKDYLDNVLELEYEEFFITSSWVNIMSKGEHYLIHNHSNSILSGVLYLKSEPGHPPLIFRKHKMETGPFISLEGHYKKTNPNTTIVAKYPCKQDTMIIFNSNTPHGHDANELESERIGIAWNGLVNFVEKDEDLYRIRFVKEYN